MDRIAIRKIEMIVTELLSEFRREGGKLQAEYDDNFARISEIEDSIQNYRENEDVDFQVFSPRKIDNHNEEKIDAMNTEKDSIESINKSLYRQIKYYTEKIEKLEEILKIVDDEDNQETVDQINSEYAELDDYDEIRSFDQKIMAYYDAITDGDSENIEDKSESIHKEDESEEPVITGRMGWKLLKDELEEPVDTSSFSLITDNKQNDDDLCKELQSISIKLSQESKAIEEDYYRRKDEIKTIIESVNSILETLKK